MPAVFIVTYYFSPCQSSVDYGHTKITQVIKEREREKKSRKKKAVLVSV